MSKIVDREYDCVCVSLFKERIELRIGEEFGDKGSRFTWLTPKEARKVAIALLQTAEQIDERAQQQEEKWRSA